MTETTVSLRSNFDVELVEVAGSDTSICRAARVSTLGSGSADSGASEGLIRFLMKNRHGSPFEHAMLTYRISAPIMVWREFMRHRVGVSYNEQSGRYMELEPVFYIPERKRPLVQVGKPGHYTFQEGTAGQYDHATTLLIGSYQVAWYNYKMQLEIGIAKEVARLCLPVSIYSTAYVTMNPRSLMHFLSLRTTAEWSKFPSFPQYEINKVACQMEDLFATAFPITWKAFDIAGRVCP